MKNTRFMGRLIRYSMEKALFRLKDHFSGDWKMFKNVGTNPETIFYFDIDGIFANLSNVVCRKWSETFGIKVSPDEIDRFDYLTHISRENNLSEDDIEHAEERYQRKMQGMYPLYAMFRQTWREQG